MKKALLFSLGAFCLSTLHAEDLGVIQQYPYAQPAPRIQQYYINPPPPQGGYYPPAYPYYYDPYSMYQPESGPMRGPNSLEGKKSPQARMRENWGY